MSAYFQLILKYSRISIIRTHICSQNEIAFVSFLYYQKRMCVENCICLMEIRPDNDVSGLLESG